MFRSKNNHEKTNMSKTYTFHYRRCSDVPN